MCLLVPAVPCIPPPITRRPPPATPLSKYFVSFELHHPSSKALAPTIERPANEAHTQLTLRTALLATTPSPRHHSHVVLYRANRLEQQGPARSYGCCLRRPRRNCHPWLPATPAQHPALAAKAIKAGEQRRRTKLWRRRRGQTGMKRPHSWYVCESSVCLSPPSMRRGDRQPLRQTYCCVPGAGFSKPRHSSSCDYSYHHHHYPDADRA